MQVKLGLKAENYKIYSSQINSIESHIYIIYVRKKYILYTRNIEILKRKSI